MTKFNEVLLKIAEALQTDIKTEKLIGKEFTLGEYTCIPILSVSLGDKKESKFKKGSNGKHHEEEEGEMNGSPGLYPAGFLVTKGERVFFVPAITVKGLREEIDKIPDMIEKFRNIKRKKTAKA